MVGAVLNEEPTLLWVAQLAVTDLELLVKSKSPNDLQRLLKLRTLNFNEFVREKNKPKIERTFGN